MNVETSRVSYLSVSLSRPSFRTAGIFYRSVAPTVARFDMDTVNLRCIIELRSEEPLRN